LEYPEICLQSLGPSKWWVPVAGGSVTRGRLLWAVVPHVDQHPFALITKGRTEDTDHARADYEVVPLRQRTFSPLPYLPVAGMPDLPGELKIVSRAKRRLVLVIGNAGIEVEKSLRIGDARFHTNRTLLVAPYYSAKTWRPELVEKIRRCAYPQFIWDRLPFSDYRESILRLDHVQPIGNHGESFELIDLCLSEDALTLVEDQFIWLRTGRMPAASDLTEIRVLLLGR
jgi:hypothetical protein